MQSFPPTVILRHRKENLKKCSLRGLEHREDFKFYTYPDGEFPVLPEYILLAIDGEPLSPSDSDRGLFVLDATWRYAQKMCQFVESKQPWVKRSIPGHWRTAYPRRQSDCPNPELGLASIEAIYAAYQVMGRDTTGLLDGYYWKDQFLEKNS
jgi:pre-rRNA-processing protein TSR3